MANGELASVTTTSSIHATAAAVTSGHSVIETSVVSTLADGHVTTVASSTLVPVLESFDGAAVVKSGFFAYVLAIFFGLL
ncbi:unnamed protein product [Ambrosiozyma monospora]|uniref:Unnamed protein product n=1 Tax=Ambrosiozyma monospora TaxID=43982 RepID=A0A9W6Z5F6_AMBMO|nr:unnamed protein product [Ambrosiozyma monospora]